jgi:hypothetical protein
MRTITPETFVQTLTQQTTETCIGSNAGGTFSACIPAYTRTRRGCHTHHGLLISDDTATRAAMLADVLLPGMCAGHEMVMVAAADPGTILTGLDPYFTRYARDDVNGWEQIIRLTRTILWSRCYWRSDLDGTKWPGPTATDPLITLVLDDAAPIHQRLSEQAATMIADIATLGPDNGVRLIQGLADLQGLEDPTDAGSSDFWQQQIGWTVSHLEPYPGTDSTARVAITVGTHPVTLDAKLLTPNPEVVTIALAAAGHPRLNPRDRAAVENLWQESVTWIPGTESRRPSPSAGLSPRPAGVQVPSQLRPWSVDWPEYTPVDITQAYLRLDGTLAESVAAGWAEPATDPTHVDLVARQQEALVPWDIVDGRPRNPNGRTGRTGRDLGRWAENQAADPIVVAGEPGDWHLLLIRRDDCGDWAIPGGMVEPGELAPAALVRELHHRRSLGHVHHRAVPGAHTDPRDGRGRRS